MPRTSARAPLIVVMTIALLVGLSPLLAAQEDNGIPVVIIIHNDEFVEIDARTTHYKGIASKERPCTDNEVAEHRAVWEVRTSANVHRGLEGWYRVDADGVRTPLEPVREVQQDGRTVVKNPDGSTEVWENEELVEFTRVMADPLRPVCFEEKEVYLYSMITANSPVPDSGYAKMDDPPCRTGWVAGFIATGGRAECATICGEYPNDLAIATISTNVRELDGDWHAAVDYSKWYGFQNYPGVPNSTVCVRFKHWRDDAGRYIRMIVYYALGAGWSVKSYN